VVNLKVSFETIYLLKDIKLFMEKKGRNVEESNADGRITDVASLVAVDDQQNNLNKEVQTGDNPTICMYACEKASTFTFHA
jgi:hypothetical protein